MKQSIFKIGLAILAINVITLFSVVTFSSKQSMCVQVPITQQQQQSGHSLMLAPAYQPKAIVATYRF